MRHPLTASLLRSLVRTTLILIAAPGIALPAAAEKSDRNQRMTIAADQQSTLDLLKQIVVFNGNVVITQGTLSMRADRVEVHENADGFRNAIALGGPGRPANFRQKRDGVDEYVEGYADRIEYDGHSDTVHFIGHAQVRRLRGAAVADEINGNQIDYDNVAESFAVQGGPTNVTPSNPGGRVRAVLAPRDVPASGATVGSTAMPLTSSTTLGDRK